MLEIYHPGPEPSLCNPLLDLSKRGEITVLRSAIHDLDTLGPLTPARGVTGGLATRAVKQGIQCWYRSGNIDLQDLATHGACRQKFSLGIPESHMVDLFSSPSGYPQGRYIVLPFRVSPGYIYFFLLPVILRVHLFSSPSGYSQGRSIFLPFQVFSG